MTTWLFDTNPILRFLLNDIPAQSNKTRELMAKARAGDTEIVVDQIVVFEVEFALRKYYKLSKAEVIDTLGSLMVTPYLKIQDADIFSETLAMFSAASLSFVDCFLICHAKSHNFSLFTFDKDLQKLLKTAR